MNFELTYKPYGERSILVEWPSEIDKSILYDILLFSEKLKYCEFRNIMNFNISYNSILVVYNVLFDVKDEIKRLQEVYDTHHTLQKKEYRLWKIPVCYDEQYGIDLEVLSNEKGLSKLEIIKRHSQAYYTVYFIGFLPGFLYLGGLDTSLHTPRKATPRLKIDKGAVAIGGKQTGVYPSESPGGWHVIGNSPISFFNPSKEEPCFAKPGDAIKFFPVTLKEYELIKTLVSHGVYNLESEVIID